MSNRKKNTLEIVARILILAVIIIAMAIIRPESFWTVTNLSQVVFQQAPFTMLMAFGMSLAIITKGIDVSMASVMVLSNYVSASFFLSGHYLLGTLVAFGIGIGFGLCNGLLISRIHVQPYIATFSVDFIALGLAYVVCNGNYIYGFPDSFRQLTNGELIPGLPNVALITIVVFILLFVVTRKTTFGRGLYAIGHNKDAAQLSGIKTDRIIFTLYAINGMLAALTGILYLSRLNAADPSIKGNLTMDSIAAALIGGIPFCGGKGTVVNTVIGALIIMFIRNGMNIMNISTNWQQTVVGAIILFSIFYDVFVQKIAKNMDKRKEEKAEELLEEKKAS
jgi:ribose transport system permease protein